MNTINKINKLIATSQPNVKDDLVFIENELNGSYLYAAVEKGLNGLLMIKFSVNGEFKRTTEEERDAIAKFLHSYSESGKYKVSLSFDFECDHHGKAIGFIEAAICGIKNQIDRGMHLPLGEKSKMCNIPQFTTSQLN